MIFSYGKNDWKDLRRGQENCYLLTNRLGGYSSVTMIDSLARNEHGLLMGAVKAPNEWVQFVTKLEAVVRIDGTDVELTSQEYLDPAKNQYGCRWLNSFSVGAWPEWDYQVEGVRVKRSILMKYESNLVMARFVLENQNQSQVQIRLRPWFRFTPKGIMPEAGQEFLVGDGQISSNGYKLYFKSDLPLTQEEPFFVENLYFEQDERDGREFVGSMHSSHYFACELEPGEVRTAYLIYSMDPIHETPDELAAAILRRRDQLADTAGLTSELGRTLTQAADAFIVDRASTGSRTIIAGYPFFGDWGRDTMIAVMGCCVATGRAEDAKSIFRTFMKYIRKGIMPNMFPDGAEEPRYNTVDASLLFICAVYEYYLRFLDEDFVREAMPVMQEIIDWYETGTDFDIRMNEDGLISAGSGYDQVTWMDVRIQDILPTPRHGKPVEINAYWYNDLRIMARFAELTGQGNPERFLNLAERVRQSFRQQFWNSKEGCLKDVVSGQPCDDQIRCNQIWALSLPFGMLDQTEELQVLHAVYRHLHTPYGLRSLSPKDPEFKPNYGGSLWDRDNAYHQGTVWTFPLGAYYLAYLKVHRYSDQSRQIVIEQLDQLSSALREGCVGQLPEIYDGLNPNVSRGCFAQAWSVGELLRAVRAVESE